MFRNYPLTCLFILATICVDAAIVVTADQFSVLDPHSGWRFYIWNFGIPAQVSSLALWAIYGTTYRLTKAASVTYAGGMLILIAGLVLQQPYFNESVSFNLIQILAVMAGAVIFRLTGVGRPEKVSNKSFRFSLVEMFGWSMIVALWAFALRSTTAGFLVDRYFFLWITTAAVTPILLVPVLFTNISTAWRCGGLIAVFAIMFVAYRIADRFVGDNPIALWALSMAITQIIYITAWRIFLSMDKSMQERSAISAATAGEKLSIYDPNES